MAVIVEGKAITREYSNNQGLHGIDFAFNEGRIIALAGGNGAGKSTLIRLLIEEEEVDAGEFVWADEKSIRYMPDDVNFPLALTAQEIIQLLANMKQLPKERCQEVLERVGLWEHRKQRVRQYSRGMRQRLNLAQSLLGEEQLLILDEPTNGLDPIGIQELRKLIRSFPEQGITVILSSHILHEVEQVVDDIGIIADGKLGYQGPAPQGHELESLFMQVVTANRKAGH